MSGKLYIVGTPLGNLGDLTPRAAETLAQVDFIAAEDTRVSVKLLNHLGIKKPMISYYEHNIHQRGQIILERLLTGESCAVVTDAGMPCISDPGEDLVRLCGENGVETVVVPGPSAVVAALALSGLPTGRFSFEGFLSVKKGSRFSHLEELKQDTRTLVFYEAPHKLPQTLADMLEVFGNRNIALCREMTKLHEEVIRTTLSQAVERYAAQPPKGEFVLVIEGAAPFQAEQVPLDEAVRLARRLAEEGNSPSAAAKEAAAITGHRKGDLYRALVNDES
ncbi:16S rRNA (cytidine(1402)-2'-O)-methyltransferase [Ruminococcaceae bacterium OttesenSCG-928-L11]|nr:16S rRNA (cytidine(1402)-2'-O)-methyltransferase [Ruminococcaceae bacterium OttesenSCG-928-L11]